MWVSAKFGTCIVVSVKRTHIEEKMRRFKGECAHFSFNKCPVYTHDGAIAKFSTNSHKTNNSVVLSASSARAQYICFKPLGPFFRHWLWGTHFRLPISHLSCHDNDFFICILDSSQLSGIQVWSIEDEQSGLMQKKKRRVIFDIFVIPDKHCYWFQNLTF